MELHNNIERAYQAFLTEVQKSRVVLLHPRSKYRSVILARILHDAHTPAFYYALGHDDIKLQTFIEGITHDMANQHATFGRHINMLPHTLYADFNQHTDLVLEAFIKELYELSDEPFYFILDEYDRSDEADDVHRFIEKAADYLPPHCTLVINSRTLPRLPWVAMIAKGQASMLVDDVRIEENFYQNKQIADEYQLEVYALGPGTVLLDGEAIDAWEGHLPRLLFFFALDRPLVTRAEICNAFWPELDADQAVNVFHVTKRRLHKALDRDILLHHDTHYEVNPDYTVYFDIIEFVEILMRGRDATLSEAERFEAWNKVSQLYGGPFLQGHTEEWIVRRRDAFRAGYLEALEHMATRWIEQDRLEVALKLYQQGLEANYYREDFHRSLMHLYNKLGRRSEAVAHYKALAKHYKQEKLTLEPETEALSKQISAS